MHPTIDILGRHVTVISRAVPEGRAYRAVETTRDAVLLSQVLPGHPLPEPGERIACISGAGRWRSQVQQVQPPDRIALLIPRWVRREARRGAVRVPVAFPTELRLPGGGVGARLEDLSVTGGSFVVEASVAPGVGALLWCRLPGGEGTAVVRNRRPHAHALLTTLGVSWRDLGTNTRAWIASEVSLARSRRDPGPGHPVR